MKCSKMKWDKWATAYKRIMLLPRRKKASWSPILSLRETRCLELGTSAVWPFRGHGAPILQSSNHRNSPKNCWKIGRSKVAPNGSIAQRSTNVLPLFSFATDLPLEGLRQKSISISVHPSNLTKSGNCGYSSTCSCSPTLSYRGAKKKDIVSSLSPFNPIQSPMLVAKYLLNPMKNHHLITVQSPYNPIESPFWIRKIPWKSHFGPLKHQKNQATGLDHRRHRRNAAFGEPLPRQLLHADAIHLKKNRRYKWWVSTKMVV